MGIKNLKNHYRIGHIVRRDSRGICIGSPYTSDLIVISEAGEIIQKKDFTNTNEDLARYLREFESDPAKLREVLHSEDIFEKSIRVYTYEGAEILEAFCEEPGWPNLTHDGRIMYGNTFSTDREFIIRKAKENAECSAEFLGDRVKELESQLIKAKAEHERYKSELAKLNADFPETEQPKP